MSRSLLRLAISRCFLIILLSLVAVAAVLSPAVSAKRVTVAVQPATTVVSRTAANSAAIGRPQMKTAMAPSLSPGESVEREVQFGEAHTYRLAMRAGEYFCVSVAQQSSDVTLALLDPAGKTIAELNWETNGGGLESLWDIASRNSPWPSSNLSKRSDSI